MTRIAVIATLAVLCFAFATADLDWTRVHLVDAVKTSVGTENLFFRGNFPTNKTGMQYDTMISYMRRRAMETGNHTLASNVYIIDVSFNNAFDDDPSEHQFWEKNPSKGKYINWPLGVAGLLPPSSYSEEERRRMANSTVWDVDKIPDRIIDLRELVISPGPIDPATGRPRPVAVYVHCTAGCDRTGQVVAAYRLSYMINKDHSAIQTIFGLNVKECGRSPNYFSTCGTEWHCLYFSINHNDRDVGNCLHIADCELFGKCTWPPKNPNATSIKLFK